MSSFTSNFKREAAVLGVVALALLSCELGMRRWLHRVSRDAEHIEAIPGIVSALAGAGRPSVLVMGNSLTRAGIVPRLLPLDGARVAIIHPDDTTISEWLYLYERHVRSRGVAPELLLIGFAGDQLSDSAALHVDRLGRLGGLGALSGAFRHDVRDLDGRASYLLATVSSAYADRDRVRTQTLGTLIPGYKASSQALNRAAASGTARAQPVRRYERLTRFLRPFKGSSTRVVFFTIPVPTLHDVDPALEAVLAENGARLLDLRHIGDLSDSDFPDGYHLSRRGGEVFTRELSRRLLAADGLRGILEPATARGR